MSVDPLKTLVCPHDVYELREGMKHLVARAGSRVTADFALKHGIVAGPAGFAMETKVRPNANKGYSSTESKLHR